MAAVYHTLLKFREDVFRCARGRRRGGGASLDLGDDFRSDSFQAQGFLGVLFSRGELIAKRLDFGVGGGGGGRGSVKLIEFLTEGDEGFIGMPELGVRLGLVPSCQKYKRSEVSMEAGASSRSFSASSPAESRAAFRSQRKSFFTNLAESLSSRSPTEVGVALSGKNSRARPVIASELATGDPHA